MNRIARMGVVLLLTAGCRESTTEVIPAGRIAGTWTVMRAANDPPGSSESLTIRILPQLPPGLPSDDAQLEGDGAWAGEAGPTGTSTMQGWVKGDSVTLDITYVYSAQFGGGTSRVAHFAGRLTDENTMTGSVSLDGGATGTVTWQKMIVDPVG